MISFRLQKKKTPDDVLGQAVRTLQHDIYYAVVCFVVNSLMGRLRWKLDLFYDVVNGNQFAGSECTGIAAANYARTGKL